MNRELKKNTQNMKRKKGVVGHSNSNKKKNLHMIIIAMTNSADTPVFLRLIWAYPVSKCI